MNELQQKFSNSYYTFTPISEEAAPNPSPIAAIDTALSEIRAFFHQATPHVVGLQSVGY